jgi:hypothetical protein
MFHQKCLLVSSIFFKDHKIHNPTLNVLNSYNLHVSISGGRILKSANAGQSIAVITPSSMKICQLVQTMSEGAETWI